MADMRYNTDDLRTGGKHADAAAQAAEEAASTLTSAQGGPSPFGNVTGADALHGAVGHAQHHHAINAQTTSKNMDIAAVRASGAAGLGDDNTDETTKLAPRSAPAADVAKGM
jgi:hypothetical protein